MLNVTRKVGKYEVGRTIGEGTFAKVKFARNMETGENVAMKVLVKSTILKHRMVDQIKREISIMKIVRHPNIVRLHEVHQGRLKEHEARRYFQQLIDAVDHCHCKGVYHRDLKPENLLLDTAGNLKVSDFGLSALPRDGVGLLYTTCGTPNYVAPEVLSHQGYDGAAADIWSCGVILYVLMAGYLPFDETDLPTLYKKFTCPFWFSPEAKALIDKILIPDPKNRTGINEIRKDPWFRRNYVPVYHSEEEQVNLDDVSAVFDDIEDQYVAEKSECAEGRPLLMNAFEMITLSQGLNLSALFDRHQTRLEGMSMNKTGQLAAVLEVYEVAPSLFMVDVRKASGETLEYHKVLPIRSTRLQHLFQQMPG
ncbi:CBL-interacting serine/threonine-protein kinase 24 [Linum perenne]